MARKTRVSLTRGMIVAAAARGLTPMLAEHPSGVMCVVGEANLIVGAKHPATTASHEPAKIATIHGFCSNTARTRRKKRRDVNVIVRT